MSGRIFFRNDADEQSAWNTLGPHFETELNAINASVGEEYVPASIYAATTIINDLDTGNLAPLDSGRTPVLIPGLWVTAQPGFVGHLNSARLKSSSNPRPISFVTLGTGGALVAFPLGDEFGGVYMHPAGISHLGKIGLRRMFGPTYRALELRYDPGGEDEEIIQRFIVMFPDVETAASMQELLYLTLGGR